MDLVIFEEFAGTEAIHVADLGQRAELLRCPSTQRFRHQLESLGLPRVYHRNFNHTKSLAVPMSQ